MESAPTPTLPTLETLYRISSLVGRTEEPREALREILTLIVAALRADSGSVALLNPDTGNLEIEVQQGLPLLQDQVPLRLGQGITGWVVFHGKPLVVPDVRAEPRYIAVRPEVRCEMAAPMEENGQVIGVINLDADSVGRFGPADLKTLESFTAEATRVVQRLWTIRHLQEKARQFEALIDIGQSLVSKLEQQELLDSIARDARQVMRSRLCALYLFDRQENAVQLVSLVGEPGFIPPVQAPRHTPFPLESCLVASVLHTEKPIEYANVQNAEFLDVIDLPRDESLRSLLAAPLLGDAGPIGVLAVFTRHVHRFNNDEKRLLNALASLGGVALQNSRLYSRVFKSEESLRRNEKLTTLGLLAAEIAHEIRNPLTVLKLLFGSLGLEFPESDPRHQDVRIISEKLDQLEGIVSRVLNFAKAPSSLHSRWTLGEIVEDTLFLVRLKLSQGKIRLRFQRPEKSLLIDGNKGQLQQVLLNLILNATQAMPEGGTLTVACGRIERGDLSLVVVDVIDTGHGIPEELRGRLFDNFLSGRVGGTGLGLAIAKRILAGHHGDVELLATGPAGTTMRILLPLAPAGS